MPMPLSGLQRQILTALAHLRQGKDADTTAKIVRKTYTYLSDLEALQVVADAQKLSGNIRMYHDAPPDAPVSQYYADDNGAPWYVASAVAKWTDRKGREQARTVRVMVPKDATKAQVEKLLREEVARMLTQKKSDRSSANSWEEEIEE